MKRVCITGGPCVGKTTIINKLHRRGYRIIREAATDIIKKGEIHPVTHMKDFQKEIFLLQFAREKVAEYSNWEDNLVICDRGLYDSLAYNDYYKTPYPNYLLHIETRYSIVFLLEPLDIWVEDGIRYEHDKDFSKALTPLLYKAYTEQGSKVVTVPPVSVSERLNLIEGYLNEARNCRI